MCLITQQQEPKVVAEDIPVFKEVKESAEISFIKKKTTANKELELKFEVVKHIIEVKLQEQEARKVAADKRAHKQKLLELLEQKESEALGSKSIEEIKAELASLED